MNKLVLTLGVLIFTIPSIAQDVSKTVTVNIESYKRVSNGAFFQVITLHSEDCYVEYLSDLNFEWGNSYNVTLNETHLANPPEDVSSYHYDLISVNSQTKAPEDQVFSLLITKSLYLDRGDEEMENLILLNDSTYRYMDEINIFFSPQQKKHFDLVINKDHFLRAKFIFDQPGYIRMVAP